LMKPLSAHPLLISFDSILARTCGAIDRVLELVEEGFLPEPDVQYTLETCGLLSVQFLNPTQMRLPTFPENLKEAVWSLHRGPTWYPKKIHTSLYLRSDTPFMAARDVPRRHSSPDRELVQTDLGHIHDYIVSRRLRGLPRPIAQMIADEQIIQGLSIDLSSFQDGIFGFSIESRDLKLLDRCIRLIKASRPELSYFGICSPDYNLTESIKGSPRAFRTVIDQCLQIQKDYCRDNFPRIRFPRNARPYVRVIENLNWRDSRSVDFSDRHYFDFENLEYQEWEITILQASYKELSDARDSLGYSLSTGSPEDISARTLSSILMTLTNRASNLS